MTTAESLSGRNSESFLPSASALCRDQAVVENIMQKRYLESLECDEMQGFIFSRPLPPEEFEKLLENGGTVQPVEKEILK